MTLFEGTQAAGHKGDSVACPSPNPLKRIG